MLWCFLLPPLQLELKDPISGMYMMASVSKRICMHKLRRPILDFHEKLEILKDLDETYGKYTCSTVCYYSMLKKNYR